MRDELPDHGQGTWLDDFVVMAFWIAVAIGAAGALLVLALLTGVD